MRRVQKKGRAGCTALALAVVLALLCPRAVALAEKTESFLQGYRTDEWWVLVYCSSLAEIDEEYRQEKFSVSVGDQSVPVVDVSTVGEKGEGITYYCLVDISSSMHEEQFAQAKAVLNTICDGLEENDNMVVGGARDEAHADRFSERQGGDPGCHRQPGRRR